MKKKIGFLLFLGMFGINNVVAQETEYFCHFEEPGQQKTAGQMSFTGDGLHLTANGEIRILLVFVRFPDDTQNLGDWWLEDDDPNILNTIIDPNTSVNSTNKYNLTHFFKEMSLTDYDVVGEAISIEAPQTPADYNNKVGEAAEDIIGYISDNNLVNFADYDNWEAQGNGTNIENPNDGLVDMVVLVYKGSNFTPDMGSKPWGGCASLNGSGCRGADYDPGTLSVNNNKDVKFGFGAGSGSGAIAFADSDVRVLFNFIKHEIAHWLLCGGHPTNEGKDYRIASLLSGSFNRSMTVNAPERERLGWAAIPEITSDLNNRKLRDFIEHGDAYKYKVPNGNSNEYYYIENHQKVNIYDDATNDDTDKGIFILHTQNATTNTGSIRYLVSDGDWEWANVNPFIISDPCCGTVPLFGKVEPNPGLKANFMTKIFADEVDNEWHWLHGYKDEDGNSDLSGFYRGRENSELKASFNADNKPLFAPITNPRPQSWSGTDNAFALSVDGVDSQDPNTLIVDFYKNYNSYTITENTTWDGQIFLDQNTKVENNATLTILPGTTVYLAKDVQLNIRSGQGGKLISEGTEESPIRFLRADPGEAWKTIYLNSSAGNSIKWTLFDGGETNLTIASKNNTIEHSTFRNATYRNINTWHNNDGSGNSSATLSHVLIENAATVGLVALYTDLDISNTTIQDNTKAGLYIVAGTVNPFHHNIVTGNGSSSRDGIEVKSSGTLLMRESLYLEGHNEVSGNGEDQISNYGSLEVGQGYNGENSIYGSYDADKKYVENHSGSTVDAVNTWWG